MNKKQDILKKYTMFLKAKKILVVLATIASLSLIAYVSAYKMDIKFAPILMIISIICTGLFLLLWISIKPMKKHILEIIKEQQGK